MQRGQMRDPRRRSALPDDAGDAALEGVVRVERERDLDAIGRQRIAGAVGPFHHHHGAPGTSSMPSSASSPGPDNR